MTLSLDDFIAWLCTCRILPRPSDEDVQCINPSRIHDDWPNPCTCTIVVPFAPADHKYLGVLLFESSTQEMVYDMNAPRTNQCMGGMRLKNSYT